MWQKEETLRQIPEEAGGKKKQPQEPSVNAKDKISLFNFTPQL